MFLVCVWWVVSARKWFKGPKVNVGHMMLDREEQAAELSGGGVLEGKDGNRSSGSDDVPGAMPEGKQGGDMKAHGL